MKIAKNLQKNVQILQKRVCIRKITAKLTTSLSMHTEIENGVSIKKFMEINNKIKSVEMLII